MTKGTAVTSLLRDSPFEVHRKVYKEGLELRGGYTQTPVPTAELYQRVLEGRAVGIALDDAMAPYRHLVVLGKEVLTTGYVGYYYAPKLPLKKEIDKGLTVLQESGVLQKVTYFKSRQLIIN